MRLKTLRLEQGIHPFFGELKIRINKLKKLANYIDPQVHITSGKMKQIRGVKKKQKIDPNIHNLKIYFVTLYDHKVVQSFTFIFSTEFLSSYFALLCEKKFSNELID